MELQLLMCCLPPAGGGYGGRQEIWGDVNHGAPAQGSLVGTDGPQAIETTKKKYSSFYGGEKQVRQHKEGQSNIPIQGGEHGVCSDPYTVFDTHNFTCTCIAKI